MNGFQNKNITDLHAYSHWFSIQVRGQVLVLGINSSIPLLGIPLCGLAWETKSKTMRRYFEQFGDILEAVTFQEPEAAIRACVDASPIIDGRHANCNLASSNCGAYVGTYGYQQPISYNNQGLIYPQYGLAGYETYMNIYKFTNWTIYYMLPLHNFSSFGVQLCNSMFSFTNKAP
ncbi:hypothetical protein UlMin_027664, partial [Ulmus minor]